MTLWEYLTSEEAQRDLAAAVREVKRMERKERAQPLPLRPEFRTPTWTIYKVKRTHVCMY